MNIVNKKVYFLVVESRLSLIIPIQYLSVLEIDHKKVTVPVLNRVARASHFYFFRSAPGKFWLRLLVETCVFFLFVTRITMHSIKKEEKMCFTYLFSLGWFPYNYKFSLFCTDLKFHQYLTSRSRVKISAPAGSGNPDIKSYYRKCPYSFFLLEPV